MERVKEWWIVKDVRMKMVKCHVKWSECEGVWLGWGWRCVSSRHGQANANGKWNDAKYLTCNIQVRSDDAATCAVGCNTYINTFWGAGDVIEWPRYVARFAAASKETLVTLTNYLTNFYTVFNAIIKVWRISLQRCKCLSGLPSWTLGVGLFLELSMPIVFSVHIR